MMLMIGLAVIYSADLLCQISHLYSVNSPLQLLPYPYPSPVQEEYIRALDPASTGDYNTQVYTSLATSIFAGHANVAQILLSKTSLPIDFAGQTGNTALLFASLWGQLSSVQYLLDNGADFAVENTLGETALSVALKNGHRDVVLLLRAAGATK